MALRRLSSTHDVLANGHDRIRVGPWRGDPRIAHLTPLSPGGLLSPDSVDRCLDELVARGYGQVLTAAVGPLEQTALVDAGFEVHERLHLLSRSLDEPVPPPRADSTRRARRVDRPAVLAVDTAAFGAFWQLDEAGLDDALHATPAVRFRVSTGPLLAYAVAGRGGRSGYLQRLAVHPDAQRHGLGSALVLDALRWMRRRGAARALVNTQVGNDAAVALYERLRFRLEPDGLAVMGRTL